MVDRIRASVGSGAACAGPAGRNVVATTATDSRMTRRDMAYPRLPSLSIGTLTPRLAVLVAGRLGQRLLERGQLRHLPLLETGPGRYQCLGDGRDRDACRLGLVDLGLHVGRRARAA